jgi:hypothetical protein
MLSARIIILVVIQFMTIAVVADAKINTVVVHNRSGSTNAEFSLRFVPGPSADDAATAATVSIVDGDRDENGGELSKLNDGKVPTEADQPAESFFFAQGTDGGRLLIDLQQPIAIDQINTYSWHVSTRGPQVYRLYVSDGAGDGFNREPKRDLDPSQCGWRLVSDVDTRPGGEGREMGGQYAVSIFDSEGPIGKYRYLLLDASRTQNEDPFGNTFFSEIDVIASTAPEVPEVRPPLVLKIEGEDGTTYEATIDTSDAPDLTEWAEKELAPVVTQWYPKIVKMLPSDGYEAPRSFSITISPRIGGVAAAAGTRVRCSAVWFRRNLEGEAKGAVVHELVHVVQQYGRARRINPQATRSPGWLVEGIADYIRWFLYEPETRGAEITQRNIERARYDGSYRVSANFLNWVTQNCDREVVPKLNAALREGRYREELWTEYTQKSVSQLGDEWKLSLERQLAQPADE